MCPIRVQQQGVDPGAPAGQAGAGVERVAAVVAGADEEEDVRAVDGAENLRRTTGEAGGGALHERALGQPRHECFLGRAHLRDPPGSEAHSSASTRSVSGNRSATTMADAMPPSWDSERCQRLIC